ncbi:hypothetical protein ACOSQ2_024222 [Xanthoceras sorbifolium]
MLTNSAIFYYGGWLCGSSPVRVRRNDRNVNSPVGANSDNSPQGPRSTSSAGLKQRPDGDPVQFENDVMDLHDVHVEVDLSKASELGLNVSLVLWWHKLSFPASERSISHGYRSSLRAASCLSQIGHQSGGTVAVHQSEVTGSSTSGRTEA